MNQNLPEKIIALLKTSQTPIVVGVTGHRNLVKSDYSAIFDEIKRNFENIARILERQRATIAQPSMILLTGLAQGGDMLAAKVARELNVPYVAVLPCQLSEFKKSFDDEEALRELDEYIANAKEVVIVDDVEKNFENQPNQTKENYRYRQVGVYLAKRSTLLLALWDGVPTKRQYGCGTADVVKLTLDEGKPVLWLTCNRTTSTTAQPITTRYL